MEEDNIQLLTIKLANMIKRSEFPLMFCHDIETFIGVENRNALKVILNRLNKAGIIQCRLIKENNQSNDPFEQLDNIILWFDDIRDLPYQKISSSLSRAFVIRKSYQTAIYEREIEVVDKENELNTLSHDTKRMDEEVKRSQRIGNDPEVIRICHEIKKIEEETENWRDALSELLKKLSEAYCTSKEETIIKLRIPVHTRRLARLD